MAGQPRLKRVIIDEVQKLPRILDVVHQLIEEKNIQFILSGSSARKLKRGGAKLQKLYSKIKRPFRYWEEPFLRGNV